MKICRGSPGICQVQSLGPLGLGLRFGGLGLCVFGGCLGV